MKNKILNFSFIFLFFSNFTYFKNPKPSTAVLLGPGVEAKKNAEALSLEIVDLKKQIEELTNEKTELEKKLVEKAAEIEKFKIENEGQLEEIKKIAGLEEQIESLQNEITVKKTEIEEITETKDSKIDGLNQSLDDIKNTLTVTTLELKNAKKLSLTAEQLKKLVELKEQLKNQDFSQTQENLSNLINNFNDLQEKIINLKSQAESAGGDAEFAKQLEKKNSELEKKLNDLRKVFDLQTNFKSEIVKLEQDLRAAQGQVSQVGLEQEKYEQIAKKNQYYVQALAKSTQALAKSTQDISSLSEHLEKITQSLDQAFLNFDQLKSILGEHEKFKNASNSQIESLKAKLQAEQERNAKLENEKTVLIGENKKLAKRSSELGSLNERLYSLIIKVDQASGVAVDENRKGGVGLAKQVLRDLDVRLPHEPEDFPATDPYQGRNYSNTIAGT